MENALRQSVSASAVEGQPADGNLQLAGYDFVSASGRQRSVPRFWKKRFSPTEVLTLGLLLMTLQALDGMLTVIGVTRFGAAAEGNPLLRYLITHFGTMPVVLLKVFAICLIGLLCAVAYRIRWIPQALAALCCVYVAFAVGPWSYILFVRPLVF